MRRVALGFVVVLVSLLVSSAAFAADWKVGDKCEVEWKGSWYTSTILEVKDGKYKIHYDGWGPEWDEFVGPERMRPAAAWKVGDTLEVEWKGKWYAATILEVKDGTYKIHYDGWGPEWDEYVGPQRMRKKP